jgi:RNA polymerase sigma factor (sigma-70 family)
MVMTHERELASDRAAGRRLEDLYRAHAPDTLRLAYLLTGDRALAEDLAQDALVKVLGRFHDLRNRDAFWWYLRRTMWCRSHYRHRRRAGLAGAPAAGQWRRKPRTWGRDRLRRAPVAAAGAARAVVLRYYEDLSEADTAQMLGIPVGTVKSTVSRGMERLRAELEREA